MAVLDLYIHLCVPIGSLQAEAEVNCDGGNVLSWDDE